MSEHLGLLALRLLLVLVFDTKVTCACSVFCAAHCNRQHRGLLQVSKPVVTSDRHNDCLMLHVILFPSEEKDPCILLCHSSFTDGMHVQDICNLQEAECSHSLLLSSVRKTALKTVFCTLRLEEFNERA